MVRPSEELDEIDMREMPTMRHGRLPSQARVRTAIAALKELRTDELQIALQSLAQIKGPVWAANQLRHATGKLEKTK